MLPEEPPASGSRAILDAAADELLVERAIDGDVRAFRVLLTRHSSLLRAYVTRIVGSSVEADDVVQDTFVIAWRQLPALRDHARVKAWLMRIATRQAFRHLKKRPADAVLPPELAATVGGDPEATAVRNAQLTDLARALDALPEDQRRCWLLREVAGLTYQDIAAETGLTAAQVRGNLARARSSITIRMEGWR